MAKRKDSSKKKRKGSGNGLLIAAVLLTILFLAGVMSLGALYYLEKNKEKPQTIPPKITEAAAWAASLKALLTLQRRLRAASLSLQVLRYWARLLV